MADNIDFNPRPSTDPFGTLLQGATTGINLGLGIQNIQQNAQLMKIRQMEEKRKQNEDEVKIATNAIAAYDKFSNVLSKETKTKILQQSIVPYANKAYGLNIDPASINITDDNEGDIDKLIKLKKDGAPDELVMSEFARLVDKASPERLPILKEIGNVYGIGKNNNTANNLTPEQSSAINSGDINALSEIYKDQGGVPPHVLSMALNQRKSDLTVGTKKDQYIQKRLTALGDALDPSKQRQGAFGVSKQVFDRAERLQSLANAFPDGNLDSRQIEELAIGLNAMLSGSNTGAQQQVAALVPKTIVGNAQKTFEWLSNNPQGTNQQEFVKRLLNSVEREKQTAADQIKRTQFQRIGRYSDLQKTAPDEFYNVLEGAGIDPSEYKAQKEKGFGNMNASQGPENKNPEQNGNLTEIQKKKIEKLGQKYGF